MHAKIEIICPQFMIIKCSIGGHVFKKMQYTYTHYKSLYDLFDKNVTKFY